MPYLDSARIQILDNIIHKPGDNRIEYYTQLEACTLMHNLS